MKSIRIALIMVITLLLFTSCTPDSKLSMTAKEFQTSMSNKEYKVTDAKEQFSGYSYIEKAYTATSKDKKFKVSFFQVDSNEYAELLFQNDKSIFQDAKSTSASEESQSKGNYERYSLSTKDIFKFISRVDNTILFIDIDAAHKSEAEKIISELGY